MSNIILSLKSIIQKGFKYNNNGIVLVKMKLNGTLLLDVENGYLVKSKIYSNGQNNKILLSDEVKINNCEFVINGDNCTIDLRGNRIMKNTKFELLDSNTSIHVNVNTGFNKNRILVAGNGNKISIGSDCIFAEEAQVWASDTHSIINEINNERINPDLPIMIGIHVWIGSRALIFKGVIIENDVIVGAASIVTKNISKNTMVAGVPARELKSDINWDINRI